MTEPWDEEKEEAHEITEQELSEIQEEKVRSKLLKYEDLLKAKAVLDNQTEALRQEVIAPEADTIRKLQDEIERLKEPYWSQLDEVDKAAKVKTDELDKNIAKLKKEIETEGLEVEHTVHGNTHMAVYNKPGRDWDSEKLEGYAIAHPEIVMCSKPKKAKIVIRAK